MRRWAKGLRAVSRRCSKTTACEARFTCFPATPRRIRVCTASCTVAGTSWACTSTRLPTVTRSSSGCTARKTRPGSSARRRIVLPRSSASCPTTFASATCSTNDFTYGVLYDLGFRHGTTLDSHPGAARVRVDSCRCAAGRALRAPVQSGPAGRSGLRGDSADGRSRFADVGRAPPVGPAHRAGRRQEPLVHHRQGGAPAGPAGRADEGDSRGDPQHVRLRRSPRFSPPDARAA